MFGKSNVKSFSKLKSLFIVTERFVSTNTILS